MTVFAENALGEKAARGKVLAASLQLYVGSRMVRSEDMEPHYYPFRINDMTAWLKRAAHQLRSPDLNKALKEMGAEWEIQTKFLVNGQDFERGIKTGRGRSEVRFNYEMPNGVRLDIILLLKQHAQILQEKKRLGLHKPKAKPLQAGLFKFGDMWAYHDLDGHTLLCSASDYEGAKKEYEQAVADGEAS